MEDEETPIHVTTTTASLASGGSWAGSNDRIGSRIVVVSAKKVQDEERKKNILIFKCKL